ncbi:hypothetical protein KFK09_025739 [Dendrobium nobile]|uniref:Uncharacterized protein n=1 Tax=Dendrobium nobile TaxID=94219 RepID=A0A8T3A602_DENNO|nr:hypothetical protein KFK09_025739 [Dendrobium nobile]
MEYRKVDSLEYLGLPLVMRKPVTTDFGNLNKSAQGKINLWGKKHLSYVGRALLIRTALLSIPMYLVTHTTVPHGVLNTIEKIARRFLWQKDANSRGMHYVAWKELCQPRSKRGLGFYSLVKWQGALQARLAWDLLQNPDFLLYKLLLAKYGMEMWSEFMAEMFLSLGRRSRTGLLLFDTLYGGRLEMAKQLMCFMILGYWTGRLY